MIHEVKQETVEQSIKAAPAIGGASYALTDMPMSEWAALATIVYVVLQIILLLPKIFKMYKDFGK